MNAGLENQILSQLADIQRSIGNIEGGMAQERIDRAARDLAMSERLGVLDKRITPLERSEWFRIGVSATIASMVASISSLLGLHSLRQ